VSPVKYELGFYIPEHGIIHSHSSGNIKSYVENFMSISGTCELCSLELAGAF
jgi:hypothetical protein